MGKRIQDENYNRVEIEEVQVREDTDTKIFNSEKEIIKDVIKKYEEYCEKDKLNFGYLLGEGGIDLTSTYDSSSVKGHSL